MSFQKPQLVETFTLTSLETQPLQCRRKSRVCKCPFTRSPARSNGLGKHLDMIRHRKETQMLESKCRNSKNAEKICRELLPRVDTDLDFSEFVA